MLLSEITDIDPLKWNKELKPEENNPIIASSPNCLCPLFSWLPKTFILFVFFTLGVLYEGFFQKRVTRTELDIYVFILNLLHYWMS
jgi:hypothetical protein